MTPGPAQSLSRTCPLTQDAEVGWEVLGWPSQASDTPSPHSQGPLSVFSARNRWRLVGPVHVTRGEAGFGLTLRGDAPVLIAAVIPGGPAAVRPLFHPRDQGPGLSTGCWRAGGRRDRGQRCWVPTGDSRTSPVSPQAAGLHEGDYIVSLNGQPCKWWRHAEVVAQLRGVGDEGVSLQVATLLPRAEPPGTVSPGGPRTPKGMGKSRARAGDSRPGAGLLGSSPPPSAGLVPTLEDAGAEELQVLSRGLHPALCGARPSRDPRLTPDGPATPSPVTPWLATGRMGQGC